MLTYLRDDRRRVVRQRESRIGGGRTVCEKGDSAVAQSIVRLQRLRLLRNGKRWHLVHDFAGNTEALARGCKYPHVGAASQYSVGEECGGSDKMLAIVEDHEHSFATQNRNDSLSW